MAKMHRHRLRSPSPSVSEHRRPLLLGAYSFVRAASAYAGVRRISLLGSLATAKAIPKDVDLLVTIDSTMDLTQLARACRRLMGSIQSINLGADVFLADVAGRYLGRICYYRECRPRAACDRRGRFLEYFCRASATAARQLMTRSGHWPAFHVAVAKAVSEPPKYRFKPSPCPLLCMRATMRPISLHVIGLRQ
jgi:hypothetical protein